MFTTFLGDIVLLFSLLTSMVAVWDMVSRKEKREHATIAIIVDRVTNIVYYEERLTRQTLIRIIRAECFENNINEIHINLIIDESINYLYKRSEIYRDSIKIRKAEDILDRLGGNYEVQIIKRKKLNSFIIIFFVIATLAILLNVFRKLEKDSIDIPNKSNVECVYDSIQVKIIDGPGHVDCHDHPMGVGGSNTVYENQVFSDMTVLLLIISSISILLVIIYLFWFFLINRKINNEIVKSNNQYIAKCFNDITHNAGAETPS
ncbi:hypothetical protein M2451_003787 [Dysgonomonas sp. PFB1-18]|uniref:hypothetical protein n=1 Tax=unclassified Dysgonomonas TaxID=2630389 RepID=UPI0024754D3B|nr:MULTISPECIES: hypothetical protein [unclassified Dysgonomonas]MDH6310923.1 hypothetical protein [Dysgonomonas sp. PF1-14]MDH6340862.1 hypothetical protein [Dysgonomonas sp. PF1-16]MDH6382446.1 hypothetical protein [Dysgonomonas sp. PFB1-18]MDH6399795.1 hypothetical protein [Dysgonomonas sp. PF1-23]